MSDTVKFTPKYSDIRVENGELKRDGSFDDGEMDGIWVEYSADGNSIQRSRYSSGLFLYDLHWGPKELYDRAGKLRRKDVESALIVKTFTI